MSRIPILRLNNDQRIKLPRLSTTTQSTKQSPTQMPIIRHGGRHDEMGKQMFAGSYESRGLEYSDAQRRAVMRLGAQEACVSRSSRSGDCSVSWERQNCSRGSARKAVSAERSLSDSNARPAPTGNLSLAQIRQREHDILNMIAQKEHELRLIRQTARQPTVPSSESPITPTTSSDDDSPDPCPFRRPAPESKPAAPVAFPQLSQTKRFFIDYDQLSAANNPHQHPSQTNFADTNAARLTPRGGQRKSDSYEQSRSKQSDVAVEIFVAQRRSNVKEIVDDESMEMPLAECGICGRRFAEDRLEQHERACRRASKQRKVFDARKQRTEGAELTTQQGGGDPWPGESRKRRGGDSWRRKHGDLLRTIRYAKLVSAAEQMGRDALKRLPPPLEGDYSDHPVCPHCGRRFNKNAAERHIPLCANIKSRTPAIRKPAAYR